MNANRANFKIGIILLCFLIIDPGCRNRPKLYRLATGSEGTSYYKVGRNIRKIFSNSKRVQVEALSDPVQLNGKKITMNAINNCYLLSKGMVDFAIAQNDVSFDSASWAENSFNKLNLCSVLPLYSELFLIIYKKHLNPKSLRDLVKNRRVAMGPEDSGTAKLSRAVFSEFGIEPSDYFPQYGRFEDDVLSDSVDVCCLLTGFDNPRIETSLERGGKIFSFGDYRLIGKGSVADGFCLNYPLAKPYIIPMKALGDHPAEPILTIAVDAVLLTRKDVDYHDVYEFMKTILDNKQFLMIDLQDKLLSQITEKFDPLSLRFPLHEGARRYLERDKPTFLERYADSLAFFLSFFLAILGGGAYFLQWRKQRKKNRIDVFYEKIINIQNKVQNFQTRDQCFEAIEDLKNLRADAFQQLIKEKLSADESFRIFITFLQDTKTEIEQHLQKIGSN